MPWARFVKDFDFRPTPQITIGYKAGHVMNVTRPCWEQAQARGVAVKAERRRVTRGGKGTTARP